MSKRKQRKSVIKLSKKSKNIEQNSVKIGGKKSSLSVVSNDSNESSLEHIIGCCPKCKHTSSLLVFMKYKNASNKSNNASRLQILRDKLIQLESEIKLIKQEISLNSDRNIELINDNNNHERRKTGGQFGAIALDFDSEEVQSAKLMLQTRTHIAFKLKCCAIFSPQQPTSQSFITSQFKYMNKSYQNQEFYISLNTKLKLITIHSKRINSKKDKKYKNLYSHVKSFKDIDGCIYEAGQSYNSNILRIWFKNSRGFFLISFLTAAEANTISNLINVAIQSDNNYNKNNSNNNGSNSDIYSNNNNSNHNNNNILWGGYIKKKSKKMGIPKQRFLIVKQLSICLFKDYSNFTNGEQPSFKFSLIHCDFSQKNGMIYGYMDIFICTEQHYYCVY